VSEGARTVVLARAVTSRMRHARFGQLNRLLWFGESPDLAALGA
jgi:hypothetical protein